MANSPCPCCLLNNPGIELCPACSQMTAILVRFGRNEAEHGGPQGEYIRPEPTVVMWEIVALCKTERALMPVERRYLREAYRAAILRALEAEGKPLPWLGKESAKPVTEGDAGRARTSGDEGKGASPKP